MGKLVEVPSDQLPASLEAERSILGAILLDNGCVGEVETLTVDHFTHFGHRIIYGALVEMWSENVAADIITLGEFLKSRNKLEAIGGYPFLSDLTSVIVLRQSLPNYIKILHDKKQLRDIIRAGNQMVARAMTQEDKPSEILAEVERATTKVATDIQVKERDIFLDVDKFCNRYNEQIEWRVENAIEVGTNGILVGASGDGKSPVARALAVCLAAGVDWLDLRVKRARTALISREDYPGTTSRFIRRYIDGTGIMAEAIGLKHWLYIHTREQKRTLFLDDPADLRLLINNLKSRNIEFAIFDVWNTLHRMDENDPTEQRKVLNCVDLIRNEVGCQCMILHHAKQAAADNNNIVGAARGASAIDGFAEFKWRIKTDDEETGTRTMRFKVKAGFAQKPITFNIVDQPNGGVTLERSTVEEKPQTRSAKAGK